MLNRLLLLLLLMLAGCGYHLAGDSDRGVISTDVHTVSIQRNGVSDQLWVAFRDQLAQSYGTQLAIIEPSEKGEDASHHMEIRLEKGDESFVPSAYNAAGIASQYRLTVGAKVSVYQKGELLWASETIKESDDVYAVGGPAGIEAAKARLSGDLYRQWAIRAVQRLRSGF